MASTPEDSVKALAAKCKECTNARGQNWQRAQKLKRVRETRMKSPKICINAILFLFLLSIASLITTTMIVVQSFVVPQPVFISERRKWTTRNWNYVSTHRSSFYVFAVTDAATARSALVPRATSDEIGYKDSNECEDMRLDTVRVRIWRALIDGREMSLMDLSKAVNQKPPEVKFHLQHVEKQAKTLANKSTEWRQRRNIPPSTRTIKLKKRAVSKKKRKELYYKLD